MKDKDIKAEITGVGKTVRFLPNEYRECADEDGVIRKYHVPVHEPSFRAGEVEGYKQGLEMREPYKAGIKEVVDWIKDNAPIFIAGTDIANDAATPIKGNTSYYPVIGYLEWQDKLKEWGYG